ncbi:DUF2470 domain-containing protein [Actinoalloteichus spitiensis]|uniref:DUF2470 domain-containing protein n=1 Tax=Actinoalloteichus spitiensis TaxID=252394 RepID=UPI00036CA263
MVTTPDHRVNGPGAAERARSIAERGGRAALMPDETSATRVEPILHHTAPDGVVTLMLPDEHPVVARLRAGDDAVSAAVLELADAAPVPLREPVRGLLWFTGLLTALTPNEARAEGLGIAEHRPDTRLLDIGHGMSLLRLTPASMVLADAEGTCPVAPEEFTRAVPDPFCRQEPHWLRHLENAHRDVVGMLGRHVPDHLRGGRVRPLGIDRFGLRLRVEAVTGDHDVRLAFSRPVSEVRELSLELRRLVGCPFVQAVTTGP